jgi:hypothetical protein
VVRGMELDAAIERVERQIEGSLAVQNLQNAGSLAVANVNAASYDRYGGRQEAAAQREAVKNAREDWKELNTQEQKGINQMQWIAQRASEYYGGPIPNLKDLLTGGGVGPSAPASNPAASRGKAPPAGAMIIGGPGSSD